MRRSLALLLLVALVTGRGAAQTSPPPDGAAILVRAAGTFTALKSLVAEFRQRIDDPAIGPMDARGTYYQVGANRFAMRFSDPADEAIVMDGSKVWVYLPSSSPNQVLRFPMPGGPVYGYNTMAWLLDRPTERYRTTWLREESVDGARTDVLRLEPTTPDPQFRRAIVWIDQATSLPRKLEISERVGSTRTITLSRLRPDGAVPPAMVEFKAPKGVRVIDQ